MDTYEKKYNEALELARIYRDNAKAVEDYAAVARYENIFPVLRESEDERVRRHIAKFIDEQYPEHGSLKAEKEKMLTWLENQKEHHIPWYDYQKSKEAGYTIVPNEEYERLIKQKEQEPQVFCEAKAYDLGYKQGKEDAIKEQKPAEWSEEDEENFAWFDKFFRAESVIAGGRDIPQDKYLWFKSLHPQPNQEWSKEDEDKIKRLAFIISVVAEKDMISGEECIDLRNFVKSYRPSWKPSEEQMGVLGRFLKFLHESGSQDFGLMDSLLGQLKKL